MSGKAKGKSRSDPKSSAPKADGSPFEALRALRDELRREEESRAQQKARPPVPPAPKPKTKPKAAAAPDASEDALVFHRLFAGVTPLEEKPGRIPKQRIERSPASELAAKRGADEAAAEAEAVHDHIRALAMGNVRFEVADDGHRVEGRRIDVPIPILRKLRRGVVPVDARVDLHGMTADEARAHLELFLRAMRARNERCVLVIHGKGEHSPGGQGVLRGEIAAWLSQGRSSEHVAAFATAGDDDGGEGAVYVLLRR